MAWNEPGDGDKDPWERKPNDADELDESIRQFKQKFGRFFNSNDPNPESANVKVLSLVFIGVLFVLWALSGIFIVSPAEQAVILHFGKYKTTVGPGPHWIPRFIQSRYIVDEQKVDSYYYEANMLTRDENIVSARVSVQYRVGDPRAYLFNVINPVISLQQATASSLRQVLGQTTLEEALTKGRDEVRQQVQTQLTKLLDRYTTGLVITDVALQSVKAPEVVKAAFDDAINAQEDEKRFKDQAERDAQNYIQQAKGASTRLLNEAEAYKQQVILDAQARTARYKALLPQVARAPRVTRDRLYLDAMESVLEHTTKLVVDAGRGSNNMFYLPLDRLLQKSAPKVTASEQARIDVARYDHDEQFDMPRTIARTDRPDRSHIINSN